jgi:hypothetical protein
MLRIAPQPAPTRVYTIDDLPPETAGATPQPSIHIWGAGTRLNEGMGLRPAQALPSEREREIHDFLAGAIAAGGELKIQELIEQMAKESLPEGIRAELQAWVRQFKEISQEEERLIALGLLCILLESHVHEDHPLEVKDALFRWVDLSREILQGMLPENESVEGFIVQCENSLSRKKLLQEKQVLAKLVIRVQKEMLPLIAEMIDTRIEQACASLQKRMQTLQNVRRATHQIVRAEADALAQEVNQLRQRITIHVQRIAELGSEDAINNLDFNALLAQCEAIIGEV